MANNKGKMIVYGNRNTTGAMAAAMGLIDSNKQNKPKQPKQKEGDFSNGVKLNPLTQNKKIPYTTSNKPNVKYDSKNNSNYIKERNKTFKKQPSPEEIKKKEIIKTLGELEKYLRLAEEDYKKVYGSIFYLLTDKFTPSGELIYFSVYHDSDDAADILTISDEGDFLSDFIYSADDPTSIRREIMGLMSKSKWKDNILFTVGQYNNTTTLKYGLSAKGSVKDIIYLKWALIDILESLYDTDEELREAFGL